LECKDNKKYWSAKIIKNLIYVFKNRDRIRHSITHTIHEIYNLESKNCND